MKPIPIISTIIVALLVAAMVALGIWQLDRRDEKDALLARYATASKLPPIAYPLVPQGEELLFRRAGGFCLEPISETLVAGYNGKGDRGWRHIAACRTGAEGPGINVDIGWSPGFDVKSNWKGGVVSGIIGPATDHRSVIERAFSKPVAKQTILVATQPAAGLRASAPPSLEGIPNNHLAYAVQWFLFAAIASLIYALALRRRVKA